MTQPFAQRLLESPGAPAGGAGADLGLLLLGTLAHCLDNAAAVNCFQEVARCACVRALVCLAGIIVG